MNPDVVQDSEVVVALGGGNALGSYHLGACAALVEAGVEPDRWLGASIGAITVAILAGNPPETRLERLRAFWSLARQPDAFLPDMLSRARRNRAFALGAMIYGRPGIFGTRWPGLWSLLPGAPADWALRDHRPLEETLRRLVDFERLNGAGPRVSILAVDVETGEEVWFDNHRGGIRSEHLLASAALAPLFPPVEADGRLLCDAGVANNLPFDRALREVDRRTLCVAVDLFHLAHGRPDTVDETAARMQDIAFASQTRRAVEAIRRERDLLRRADPDSPPVALAHLAYAPSGHHRTLKGLDFSGRSLAEHERRGARDMAEMLGRLASPRGDAPFAYLPPPDPPDDEGAGEGARDRAKAS